MKWTTGVVSFKNHQVQTCGLREPVEWIWKWVREDESKAKGPRRYRMSGCSFGSV